jgi:biotin carboxyl carrier protein
MRYFVTIGARTFEVDLSGPVPRVDGEPTSAELAAVPGEPLRHLLTDGRSFVLVARNGVEAGQWELLVDGQRFIAQVTDERTRRIRAITREAAGPEGPAAIRAPMPGLVVRVLVEPGQAVEAGQGVLTIEAMKMQNELKAAAAGTVARVAVAPGQAVEKGAVLIEFEAPSA